MPLQVAVAEPDEDGAIKVVSATQGTDIVQGAVAAVLGLPHHKVTVGQCRGRSWLPTQENVTWH